MLHNQINNNSFDEKLTNFIVDHVPLFTLFNQDHQFLSRYIFHIFIFENFLLQFNSFFFSTFLKFL